MLNILPLSAPLLLKIPFGNALADEAANGLTAWTAETQEGIADEIEASMLKDFGPSMDAFFERLGWGAGWGTAPVQAFITIGLILAVFITIYMLMMIALGAINVSDTKDTWQGLVGGLILSIMLIYNGESIIRFIYGIADTIYEWFITQNPDSTNMDSFSEIMGQVWLSGGESSEDSTYSLAAVLLGIIFNFIIMWEILKYLLEIIERFIVSALLAICFPLAASTIPSKNTRGIFSKYMQMVLSQLVLFLFNVLFLQFIASALATGEVVDLPQWFFIFGLLRAGQKVDSYMQSMGLSVAQTGGNLFDSVAGAFMGMRSMAKSVVGATQGGLSAGAAAFTAVGMKQGGEKGARNLARASALNTLAHPIKEGLKSASASGTMEQALTSVGKDQARQLASTINPRDIDSSLVNMAKAGRNMDVISAMPLATQTALAKKVYGSSSLPGVIKAGKFSSDGSFSGVMSLGKADSGRELEAGFNLGGKAFKNNMSLQGTTPDGDNFGINVDMNSSGLLNAGDTLSLAGYDLTNDADLATLSTLTGTDMAAAIATDQSLLGTDSLEMNNDGSISFMQHESLLDDESDDFLGRIMPNGDVEYSSAGLDVNSLYAEDIFKAQENLRAESLGGGAYMVTSNDKGDKNAQNITILTDKASLRGSSNVAPSEFEGMGAKSVGTVGKSNDAEHPTMVASRVSGHGIKAMQMPVPEEHLDWSEEQFRQEQMRVAEFNTKNAKAIRFGMMFEGSGGGVNDWDNEPAAKVERGNPHSRTAPDRSPISSMNKEVVASPYEDMEKTFKKFRKLKAGHDIRSEIME